MAARLTVAHGRIATPVGDLVLVATERGVAAVAFDADPGEALDATATSLGASVRRDARRTDALRREIDAYFAGRLRRFSIPVDPGVLPGGFAGRVLRATSRIPYGTVATYGEIARRSGGPRAARAAGNALNANPVPIVIACHRVVPAAGGIGGYGGDEWRKRALLDLEADA